MARIAILTSGGDAPGMNPAIRAVVTSALGRGAEVVAVRGGFRGLVEGSLAPLEMGDVERITDRGGTMLGSSRYPEMREPAVRFAAKKHLEEAAVDCLVVIGGEGSVQGSRALTKDGVAVVHIPSTIDNDLAGTDITLGVDTSLNTILTLLDSIRDTATSMHRPMVVEVMGRLSGYLTLMSAIGAGAHAAMIPERPFPWDRLRERIAAGAEYSLILVAEGSGSGREVSERLKDLYPSNPRVSVLGYIQRGGTPSFFDRLLGARLGHAAVEAALGGTTGVMISYRSGKCLPIPLDKVAGKRRQISPEVFELAKTMDILFE